MAIPSRTLPSRTFVPPRTLISHKLAAPLQSRPSLVPIPRRNRIRAASPGGVSREEVIDVSKHARFTRTLHVGGASRAGSHGGFDDAGYHGGWRARAAFPAPIQRLFNSHGMGCASNFNNLGCGNFCSEFKFIFGSCRTFFGQSCVPNPPHFGGGSGYGPGNGYGFDGPQRCCGN